MLFSWDQTINMTGLTYCMCPLHSLYSDYISFRIDIKMKLVSLIRYEDTDHSCISLWAQSFRRVPVVSMALIHNGDYYIWQNGSENWMCLCVCVHVCVWAREGDFVSNIDPLPALGSVSTLSNFCNGSSCDDDCSCWFHVSVIPLSLYCTLWKMVIETWCQKFVWNTFTAAVCEDIWCVIMNRLQTRDCCDVSHYSGHQKHRRPALGYDAF